MNLSKLVLILVTLATFQFISIHSTFAFGTAEIVPLVAEDTSAGDHYGFAMDTDGRWLVVSAKYAETAGSKTGAVYVYRRIDRTGGWKMFQKIVPHNGVNGGEYGESVAVLHNTIVVGSRFMIGGNGQQSGTVYLYQFRGMGKGWQFVKEIEPHDGADGDEFGRSVALDFNRVIVGARFASNDLGERSGAVYVYNRRNWTWQLGEKILDPDGEEEDQFGRTISYSWYHGGRLAIGCRNGSGGDTIHQGKVQIYEFSNDAKSWQLAQTIFAEDGVEGDNFGQSVSMQGNLMAVGARDASGLKGAGVGAVYLYRYQPGQQIWTLEKKLSAPDGKPKAQFGFAVAFDRHTKSNLAVSARRADSAMGKKSGQVYMYSYERVTGAWSLDEIVVPDSLEKEDEFGQSLAMDSYGGAWLVVGADESALTGHDNGGAAYVLKASRRNHEKNYLRRGGLDLDGRLSGLGLR